MNSPRAELRQLVRLAVPIAIAQAGVALMGLVDTAVVGRLGAGPLGAVGLANGLFFGIAVIGIGVMMGFDPLISQAVGAGEYGRARDLLWQSLWLALLVSALLSVPIGIAPAILSAAGIEPTVASDARLFMFFRLPGLAPLLMFVGVRSYLQAAGKVGALVASTVLGNVCNLLGDLLLVYGGSWLPPWAGILRRVPSFGAPGAGLCTSVCTVIQLLVLLLAAQRLAMHSHVSSRRPRRRDLLKASAVGVPVGLQMGAEVGIFALVGILAGRLGRESLAAHQIAIALASFTFCAALGLGSAGSVRVGWAVGAGDRSGARRSGLVAFAVGATLMAAFGCAFWLVPGALARLLTDQPEIVAAAIPVLGVCAFFQISDGAQAVGAGVLRGAGDTRFPFLANLTGHYLVGFPVALLLGFNLGMGVTGLWWGLCAGLSSVAVALFGRFWILSSRKIARLDEMQDP